MGKVKVNFGDVQDFDAIPEGVYSAIIEKIEYREPKEKGKSAYLNVEYTVVTEDEDDDLNGRKVWEVLSWAPKALFRMRDFFRAAGYEDDEYDLDVDEESNLLIDPDLSGEAVTLTIENEIYNKKEVNRVVAVEFETPPGLEESSDEEDEEEDAEEADSEDEEEEEEEEEAERKATPAKAAPAKAKASPVKATAKAAPKAAATSKAKAKAGANKRSFR